MAHDGIQTQLRALAITLLPLVASCGGSSPTPTAPSILQVAGNWVGTITSNQVSGNGPAQITIAQSGATLSGTWSATTPFGLNSGSMTGSISGSAATMTLSPSVPTGCPDSVTVTVSGNSMTGTYATFNCTVASSGGISLTKQ